MMRALDATTPKGSTALASFIASARASRLVVITDLLGDFDDVLAAARLRVASRSEVIVVHIVAEEELDPPGDALLAVDPEAPAMRRILDGELRIAYRDAFTRWLDDSATALRAAGVRYVRAMTNEAAPHLVRRIAGETARRGA
jgi:hypothetical protein